MGLQPGELPELWSLTHREDLVGIHRSYLQAGADFLKTNTFGANRVKLEGTGHSVEEVVFAGVRNAQQAVIECGHGLVFLDIGPTGKLLRPLGELDFEDAVSVFGEMVHAGVMAGADAILIETMSDIYEAKAALLAAKEYSDLPVFVTMTFDQDCLLYTSESTKPRSCLMNLKNVRRSLQYSRTVLADNPRTFRKYMAYCCATCDSSS